MTMDSGFIYGRERMVFKHGFGCSLAKAITNKDVFPGISLWAEGSVLLQPQMKEEQQNIFSVFDEVIPRSEKEKFLNQQSRVIWMTGLSGSGKTTLAKYLEQKLQGMHYFTKLLDGDNIRAGINKNLGFSESDRTENIRRIAEVSKLFLDGGIICINCFVSPTIAIRSQAREIIGDKDFIEVYVNTPLEECERRDVKGLYKKARAGEIADFTGISSPFEEPVSPDIEIKTTGRGVEECGEELTAALLPFIKLKEG